MYKTNVRITTATRKGLRAYQEDRCAALNVAHDRWLAVFDGHDGSDTAEICLQELKKLSASPPDAYDVERFLSAYFVYLDHKTKRCTSGSTASIVVVWKEGMHTYATVAILGDSPVIIIREDDSVCVSTTHYLPENDEEIAYAIERGAIVTLGSMYAELAMNAKGLKIGRAFGDCELASVLSRKPDIYTICDPKFILVASDGISDRAYYSEKEFIDALKCIAKEGGSAEDVLSWVEGVSPHLYDNTTVVVWSCI